jgi:hypothetical protein
MTATQSTTEYGFITSLKQLEPNRFEATILVASNEVKTRYIKFRDETSSYKAGTPLTMQCADNGHCTLLQKCDFASEQFLALYQRVKALSSIYNKQEEEFENLKRETEALNDSDLKRSASLNASASVSAGVAIGTGLLGLLTLNPVAIGSAALTYSNAANAEASRDSIKVGIRQRSARLKRSFDKLMATRAALADLLQHTRLTFVRLSLEASVTA